MQSQHEGSLFGDSGTIAAGAAAADEDEVAAAAAAADAAAGGGVGASCESLSSAVWEGNESWENGGVHVRLSVRVATGRGTSCTASGDANDSCDDVRSIGAGPLALAAASWSIAAGRGEAAGMYGVERRPLHWLSSRA